MRLLGIYLNDHLAGATLGVELARRLRTSHAEGEFAAPIARLCEEIEADRETLERLVERLGVRSCRLKSSGAWIAEKLGRLKLNGQLRGYSPLSRVVELEGLYLGITGKMQLWKTLERLADERLGGFEFDRLAERAARQRETVDELHSKAAERAFPPLESPMASS
jgi:hypothetical protein